MKIPTMIVYGEKDAGLGKSSYNDLKEIATSTKAQVLPEARHPAYLDQPEEWHKLLHNFLQLLTNSRFPLGERQSFPYKTKVVIRKTKADMDLVKISQKFCKRISKHFLSQWTAKL